MCGTLKMKKGQYFENGGSCGWEWTSKKFVKWGVLKSGYNLRGNKYELQLTRKFKKYEVVR